MENIWIQEKYLLLLSPALAQFKKVKDIFNFRCPFCLDSQSKKRKKSAYVYQHKKAKGLYFHCHHCGEGNKTKAFSTFLQEMDTGLYGAYRREMFMEKFGTTEKKAKRVDQIDKAVSYRAEIKDSALNDLKKISSLSPTHPAVKYIRSRQIPSSKHFLLFYCEDFPKWVNSMIPEKLGENPYDDRIVIPLFDEKREFFGFQGRALNPNTPDKLRYITIILDKDKPSVYGLSEANLAQPLYVFEGPFDSMFVPNGIAMLGSSKAMDLDKSKDIYVFDNEPRKLEILQTYHKHIENGFMIFIWPPGYDEFKDINDLVKAGKIAAHDVKKFIDENTYQGLQAKMRFQQWKRIDMDAVAKQKKGNRK